MWLEIASPEVDGNFTSLAAPATDNMALAGINAAIIAVLIAVLGFFVARYFERRDELADGILEAAEGFDEHPLPTWAPPELPVDDWIDEAERQGPQRLRSELEDLLASEPGGDREALARRGERLAAVVVASVLVPPMPRRYFRPAGQSLFSLGIEEDLLPAEWVQRSIGIANQCSGLITRLAAKSARVAALTSAADELLPNPFPAIAPHPYTSSVEAAMEYARKQWLVCDRIQKLNSRIRRFEHRRKDRRQLRWMIPLLGLAFVLGVLVPVLSVNAPLWLTLGLPFLAYAALFTQLSVTAWRD